MTRSQTDEGKLERAINAVLTARLADGTPYTPSRELMLSTIMAYEAMDPQLYAELRQKVNERRRRR